VSEAPNVGQGDCGGARLDEGREVGKRNTEVRGGKF
jgi:hypothetical protein